VPLPDSVSQAAYRIVQEALTNTLKHAHASTVDVRVRYLARDWRSTWPTTGEAWRHRPRAGWV
jgi:signal transduction histidine kinase